MALTRDELKAQIAGREKDFVVFKVVRETHLVWMGNPDETEYRLTPTSFFANPDNNVWKLEAGWYAVYRPWDPTEENYLVGRSNMSDELDQEEINALVELRYVRLETDEGT
ncbi:hypothetical protein GVX82_01565 [Patescibacteria group bacterium]|jgi:hypothetical protein|nr:hypothetical protein [Patescibacteria group bacterium]